jgi:glycosyltransferase involved in cell wall biosynthesis
MMHGPLVSVVMPVFNAEQFVRDALQSVLAQDYDPIEVIAVDDGSTDSSAAIVQSFARVRYLRQPTWSGASEARNVGITAARGEFIAFVDADDIVPPTKLAIQVGHLLEHPELAGVLGRQHWMNPPPGLARDAVWGDLDGIPILSAVFRTDVLRELGPFDEEKGGDLDMLVRLREAELSFTVLPDIVLHRRFHGGNLVAGRGLTPLPPISLKEKLARERARRAQEQNA